MSELGSFIVKLAKDLWPFRRVEPWERGLYIVFGHPLWEVGPGYYWPVIPWFMHVEPVTIVPAGAPTPLQTVFGPEGKPITFSGIALLQIVNVRAALLNVEHYRSTIMEYLPGIVAAGVAEGLGEDHIALAITKEFMWVQDFGVTCVSFKFTNYVEAFPLRAMTDTAITRTEW
jgi:hypothetical protein